MNSIWITLWIDKIYKCYLQKDNDCLVNYWLWLKSELSSCQTPFLIPSPWWVVLLGLGELLIHCYIHICSSSLGHPPHSPTQFSHMSTHSPSSLIHSLCIQPLAFHLLSCVWLLWAWPGRATVQLQCEVQSWGNQEGDAAASRGTLLYPQQQGERKRMDANAVEACVFDL